jgi:hypothetical protein
VNGPNSSGSNVGRAEGDAPTMNLSHSILGHAGVGIVGFFGIMPRMLINRCNTSSYSGVSVCRTVIMTRMTPVHCVQMVEQTFYEGAHFLLPSSDYQLIQFWPEVL